MFFKVSCENSNVSTSIDKFVFVTKCLKTWSWSFESTRSSWSLSDFFFIIVFHGCLIFKITIMKEISVYSNTVLLLSINTTYNIVYKFLKLYYSAYLCTNIFILFTEANESYLHHVFVTSFYVLRSTYNFVYKFLKLYYSTYLCSDIIYTLHWSWWISFASRLCDYFKIYL